MASTQVIITSVNCWYFYILTLYGKQHKWSRQ